MVKAKLQAPHVHAAACRAHVQFMAVKSAWLLMCRHAAWHYWYFVMAVDQHCFVLCWAIRPVLC